MRDLLRQLQGALAQRQRLFGIAEQPVHLSTYIPGAGAWVVAAIKLPMQAVPLGVVNPSARFGMVARSRCLTGEQAGGPGAMMCLKRQVIVRLRGRQPLQPV